MRAYPSQAVPSSKPELFNQSHLMMMSPCAKSEINVHHILCGCKTAFAWNCYKWWNDQVLQKLSELTVDLRILANFNPSVTRSTSVQFVAESSCWVPIWHHHRREDFLPVMLVVGNQEVCLVSLPFHGKLASRKHRKGKSCDCWTRDRKEKLEINNPSRGSQLLQLCKPLSQVFPERHWLHLNKISKSPLRSPLTSRKKIFWLSAKKKRTSCRNWGSMYNKWNHLTV